MDKVVFSTTLHQSPELSGVGVSQHRPSVLVPNYAVEALSEVDYLLQEVLQTSISTFNPIVFIGPSGTGKSALAHNLTARWKSERPSDRQIISTGADFARSYAGAVQADAIQEFRNHFLNANLVLLDNLHHLARKWAAQSELCGLLDRFIDCDQQFVVTMPDLPVATDALHARLTSRLSKGITIPLRPPNYAARRNILTQLANSRGLQFSQEALDCVANEKSGTVPELNETFNRLAIDLENVDQPIGANTIRDLIASCRPRQQPALQSISNRVARYFRQKTSDLRGPSRRSSVVRARGVAVWLCRQLTDSSLKAIGSHFGKRDHTTVLHAYKKTESLRSTDDEIRSALDELVGLLQIN